MEANIYNKYDKLVNICFESNLNDEEIFKQAQALFPKLSNNPEEWVNDEYITEYTIEMYAYSRGLNVSEKDAAHSAEISFALMQDVLLGIGIPLEKFVKLVSAELFISSELKVKHLKNLESDEGKGASKQFLETVFPKEFHKESILLKGDVTHTIINDPEKLLKERGIPIPEMPIEDIDESDS